MRLVTELQYIFSVGVKKYRTWRELRNEVIKCFPECSVCGYYKNLEVHHIQPKHIKPHLALEWDNLIVVCDDCHFHIAHCNDFKKYNSSIVEIAEYSRNKRTPLGPNDAFIKG